MGYPHPSHPRESPILSKYFGDPEARTLAGWRARGGYEALEKALHTDPQELQTVVKDSGLRGRGGAGFPTGMKWSFMKPDGKTHYLCCNADESEPGTFKDREIMRWTPHGLVEGVALAAHAIYAQTAYIYIRGEFTEPYARVCAAVEEAYATGILGPNAMGSGKHVDVHVHRGAGAYICGEETALMNSLEGRRGNPRIKPPFPAVAGLFGKPTTINNVETLINVLDVIRRSGPGYAETGTTGSTGMKLFCLSGNIERPGVYEVPFGGTLRELIDLAGGEGRNAIFFAEKGWQVENIDISNVGLTKFLKFAEERGVSEKVFANCADATGFESVLTPVDLGLVAYLQIEVNDLADALDCLIENIRKGGVLFGVWHSRANLGSDYSGQQNPDLLADIDEIREIMADQPVEIEVLENLEGQIQTKDGLKPSITLVLKAKKL